MRDAWRETLDIEPGEWISGIVSNGGTKTVEADPLLVLTLVRLSIDRIVPIEPVGERVSERSITGGWMVSLADTSRNIRTEQSIQAHTRDN